MGTFLQFQGQGGVLWTGILIAWRGIYMYDWKPEGGGGGGLDLGFLEGTDRECVP